MMIEHLALAWLAYVVGAASPGPATLLIATTSMQRGRPLGLATAFGVLSGSLFWGILAGLGFAAVLSAAGWLAEALRIAGGCYLLYLGFKSARAAWLNEPVAALDAAADGFRRQAYARGLLVHLTNPKAIFAWLATVSIGMPLDAPAWFAFVVVATSWTIGIGIFGGYALLFATPRAQAAYRSTKRGIDATAAAVFGTAGMTLLLRRA